MEGLRTLVICQKYLSESEYKDWEHRYEEAKAAMQNRESKVRSVIESLEENMELLGVTGVEDKLQEHVETTVEGMKQAGINVWMLTGDKVETAKCIAISSGMKHSSERFFILKEIQNDPIIIQNKLVVNWKSFAIQFCRNLGAVVIPLLLLLMDPPLNIALLIIRDSSLLLLPRYVFLFVLSIRNDILEY